MPRSPSFFNPSAANSPVMQAYAADPRRALAQSLIASGSNTGPVNSPVEGLARLASALVGGYQNRQLGKEYKERGQQYGETIEQGLRAAGPWNAPDNVMSAPPDTLQQGLGPMPERPAYDASVIVPKGTDAPGTAGGLNALARVLASNPDTAPMAAEMRIGDFERKQGIQDTQDAARFAQKLRIEGIPLEAAATLPGVVNQAKALAPVTTAQALAQATALSPVTTSTAVNTAKAVGPVNTQTAIDTAAGTLPTDIAKANATAAAQAAAQAPGKVIEREGDLRKEFNALPEIKAFKDIAPAVESARRAAENMAGDLNIVYALAKTFDPGSVVREGEQGLIRGVASLPEQIKGVVDSVNGGARLTAATRANLLHELELRADSWQRQYDTQSKLYTDLASRYGASPQNVLGSPLTIRFKQGTPTSAVPPPNPYAGKTDAQITEELRKEGIVP